MHEQPSKMIYFDLNPKNPPSSEHALVADFHCDITMSEFLVYDSSVIFSAHTSFYIHKFFNIRQHIYWRLLKYLPFLGRDYVQVSPHLLHSFEIACVVTSQLFDICWCRVEVLLVIWELVLFALLVFACVAFYFKFIRLAFSFTCVTALLYMCMRLTKEERKHKRSKQRMLLPLSM